jgi:hypothetical protein
MLDWACACAKDRFWFGYDKIPKLSDLPITSSVPDAELRVRVRAKKTNSDSDMTKSPNLGIYPSLVQCEMLNRTRMRNRTSHACAQKTDSDLDMTKSQNLGIYPSLAQWEMLNCACACAKDGFWESYWLVSVSYWQVVVDRAPKNGARASPEPLVLFTRACASLGSSPTQTSP